MKGNKILKQISKILLSVCLVFAFLCSPVTKFFSKVSKVFAATPTLADVEGANVKVEGFTGTGKVGEKIKLPEVKVGSSTYNVKDTYGDLIYDVKTSSGASVTNDETATAYLIEEGGIHYLYSNVEGVYTLDIHTVSDNKLTTIVKGLQINVSKADATLSMPNTAIVESGKTGIVLPEKISLEKLKSDDFKLAVPTIHESGEMDNVVVK